MSKPDTIDQWAWDKAKGTIREAYQHFDVDFPHGTAHHLICRFAHDLMDAKAEQREADAKRLETAKDKSLKDALLIGMTDNDIEAVMSFLRALQRMANIIRKGGE